MFFGLSVSGVDYVTGIKRLVRRFAREDVYRDNLLRQLDKLHASRGENKEVLEKAVYAIKTFMDNSSHGERSSRWLLDTLEDHLPEGMLRQYNFDLRMNNRRHTAVRLTQWLELYLELLIDMRQMKRVRERRPKLRNGKEVQREQAQLGWSMWTELEERKDDEVDKQVEGKALATQEMTGDSLGPCDHCKKEPRHISLSWIFRFDSGMPATNS